MCLPKTTRHALYLCLIKRVKLSVNMFTLRHLYVSVLWLVGEYTAHKPIINHTNVCLCVWQWMLQKAVYECRRDQSDGERHASPHGERCEVNDVLCNNGGTFLPHLCCQNSHRSHSFSQLPHLMHPICTPPHSTDTTQHHQQSFRIICVCAQAALSFSYVLYRTWKRGHRSLRLLTKHVKGKVKLKPQRSCEEMLF